jgi:predicted transcriptional regulator
MKVILSIKPKYVKSIVAGSKKYEFRKQPLNPSIKQVYIYSSAPDKRIIGYFEVKQIISDTPQNLWARFRKSAGISESEFFAYYDGRSTGYAISIKNLTVLKRPIDPYKRFKKFTPPQSFMYMPARRGLAV